MNCPLCKGEMIQIQAKLWGCRPCDSIWTLTQLVEHIQDENAAILKTLNALQMALTLCAGTVVEEE